MFVFLVANFEQNWENDHSWINNHRFCIRNEFATLKGQMHQSN
jgi:hypothetical protein